MERTHLRAKTVLSRWSYAVTLNTLLSIAAALLTILGVRFLVDGARADSLAWDAFGSGSSLLLASSIALFAGAYFAWKVSADVRALVEETRRYAPRANTFEMLARLSADLLWETDADGRILFVASELGALGLNAEALRGRHLRAMLDEGRMEKDAVSDLRAALEAHAPLRNIALPVLSPSGIALTLVCNLEPRTGVKGRFLGYWGTARKLSEAPGGAARHVVGQQHANDAMHGCHVIPNTDCVLFRIRNDAARTVEYISPNVERAFGIPLERILGHASVEFYNYVCAEDCEAYRAAREAAFGAGVPIDQVFGLQLEGQPLRYVHERANAVGKDADGRPLFIDGMLMDVTRLRQAQTGYEQAADDLRHLAANADGVLFKVRLDDQNTIAYVTPNIERALGVGVDELIGKPLAAFEQWIHPDDRARISAESQAAIAARKDYALEYRVILPDGKSIWLMQRSTFERDPKTGEAVAINGFVMDITGRREIEEKLKEARDLLSGMTKSIDGVLFRVSLEGDPRILYISENIERLTGVSADLLIDKPFSIYEFMVHPEDWERYRTQTNSDIKGAKSREIKYRIVLPDGRVHWVLERARFFDGGSIKGKYADGFVVDITHQHMIEERLRESERAATEMAERFEAYTAAASDWVWQTNDAEVITYVSKGVETIGMSPECLIGKSTNQRIERDLLDPDTARILENAALRLPIRAAIVPVRGGDDKIYWLETNAAPRFGLSGEFLGYRGTTRNVTPLIEARHARDAAEKELREREALFEEITANMDGVLFRLGIEYGFPFRYVTEGIRRYTGLGAKDLIGKSVLDGPMRVHPEDRARYFEEYAKALEERGVLSVEYRAYDIDGVLHWLHETARFTDPGPDGLPRAIDGFFVDITRVKRLVAENELFAAAAAHMDSGVYICDLSREDQPIVFVNKAFTRLTGYEAHDAIGRNCRFLQGPDTDRNAIAKIREAVKAAQPVSVEILNYRKDGTPFWNELSLAPVHNPATSTLHYIAIQRDVTARRAAAEELARARDAAEAASRAKSEFLAMMSHEIRTPMNGVLGMTDALLESGLTQEQRSAAITIKSSAGGLMRIINDILDFSKLEAGRMSIEEIAFDLADLARSALDVVRPRATGRNLSVMLEIAQGVPSCLRGDAGRIRQVLLNLLGNAVKFTEEGEVCLFIDREGEDIRFQVIDTGPGIAPDRLPGLFEDYMQVDASISRRFGGTGLGLAISRRLITCMGGRIGVESREGEGTVFWFSLPLQPADAAEVEKLADEDSVAFDHALEVIAALGRPLRVLLVEDNATNRLVAERAMEKLGWQFDVAMNGLEAVLAVSRADFDVVLMDVHMPDMDGLEAARVIRTLDSQAADVPILALTANAIGEDCERCKGAGMNGFLGKPFHRRELAIAVAAILTGAEHRALDGRPKDDAAGPPSSIDWLMVDAFCADSGQDALRSLVGTYLEDSTAKLQDLAALLKQQDDAAHAARIAHSLKSASANVGAVIVSSLASELETSILSSGKKVKAADVARLKKALRTYAAEMASHGLAQENRPRKKSSKSTRKAS